MELTADLTDFFAFKETFIIQTFEYASTNIRNSDQKLFHLAGFDCTYLDTKLLKILIPPLK